MAYGLILPGGLVNVPSSGGATSNIPTGVSLDYFGATAPSGWLLLRGGSIGNAASGATVRANADTEDLFTLLWNSVGNNQLPVSGGRGASAAADFAANKNIQIPNFKGRVAAAVDPDLTVLSGEANLLGAELGEQSANLNVTMLASHTHQFAAQVTVDNTGLGSTTTVFGPGGELTEQTSPTGGDAGHVNVQPTLMSNKIIKL